MKCYLYSIWYITLLPSFISIALSQKDAVNISSELICSSVDPEDCYPKVFVPTNYWQTIKEGQDIPPGLHVRLNIDTLVREAKLLDTSTDEPDAENQVMILNQDSTQHDNGEQRQSDKVNDGEQGLSLSSGIQNSTDEIKKFLETQGGVSIQGALDNMEQECHDIEQGAALCSNPSVIRVLFRLSEFSRNDITITERIYRIFGASLQNNPMAIRGFMSYQDEIFFRTIFDELRSSKFQVIKKRILGIILPLSQNSKFKNQYLSQSNKEYTGAIIEVFPFIDEVAQERAILTLRESYLYELVPTSDLMESKVAIQPCNELSFLLQRILQRYGLSEPYLKSFFKTLTEMHLNGENLGMQPDFLEWLAAEAEKRYNNVKNHVGSPAELEFDEYVLKYRHEAFGNPMASRKFFYDEL